MQQSSVPRGGQHRRHRAQQDTPCPGTGQPGRVPKDSRAPGVVPTGTPGTNPCGAHACPCRQEGGAGLLSRVPCKPLIYLDWNNLSSAVILTTSVLRSQSGLVLIEAFMSSHKSSKMKTQGPLKYTPRVCAVQLEAFMTPVRAFMTL